MRHLLSPLLFSALLLVACGGKVGETNDAGVDAGPTPVDITVRFLAYCDGEASLAAKCGRTYSAKSLAECRSMAPCITKLYRTDALSVIISCLETRACTAKEEDCLVKATSTVPASATYTAFSAECASKSASCGMSSSLCGVGSSSGGSPSPLFVDTVLAEMRACLSLGCGELSPCLNNAISRPVAPCAPTPVDPPPPATSDAGRL